MKYAGTKAFQIHRDESAIKAKLIFETDIEDELRTFLSAHKDLGGCRFRQYDPVKDRWTVRKLRAIKTESRVNKPRLAFRRK